MSESSLKAAHPAYPQATVNAFSLAEACVALALLTAAVVMAVTLYQNSLNYGRQAENRLSNALVARQHLVALRSWLREPYNFVNYTDYSIEGLEVEPSVSVVLSRWETSSPSRSWELPEGQTRRISNSYIQARISVGQGAAAYEVTTIVGAPRRELPAAGGLSLVSTPSRLARDEEVELRPVLKDSAGDEIEDAFFDWSVRPIDGVATLTSVSRNGRRATLKNRASKRNGTPIWTGGRCRVGVGATYGGKEIWAFSEPIVLDR